MNRNLRGIMNLKNAGFSKVSTFAIVNSVLWSGLSFSALATPHHRTIYADDTSTASANCTYPDGTTPADRPELHCYDPKQFLAAYGIEKLHRMGITGKGQTIVLVDSYGSPTMQQDLDHFSDTFGLPRTTIQFVYPNGSYVNDVSDDDKTGWAEETTLDLEWSHAVAPDATLVNVVTASSETVGLAGFPDIFAGIQMAVKQFPGAIISMSFGTGEPTFESSDIETYVKGSFHQVFADATAADSTLLSSAGDTGSTNIGSDQQTMLAYANAGYPATDPLVTAVGGTALESDWKWTPQGTADDYWNCKLNKLQNCPSDFFLSILSNHFRRETVWKEDWAIAAGGGGVSTIFSAPDYQARMKQSLRKIANGYRGIPDISMNAAINGGVEMYTSFGGKNVWSSSGGTSCASPEMAGLIALAGQKASDELGKNVSIGYLNPTLYSMNKDDFYQIKPRDFGVNKQVVINNDSIYFSTALAKANPSQVPAVAVPGYFFYQGR